MCQAALTPHQQRIKAKGLCINSLCMKRKRPDANICSACASRLYKEKHPYEYSYQKLRCNARRRGKDFSLTLEEFKEFAVKCNYIDRCGRGYYGLHIDRIDENRGYHADNIQPLINHENIKKYQGIVKSRKALEGAPF